MNTVKICGLKTKEEIRWTAEAGADLGGIVVFYPKSKRNLEIGEAAELVSYAKSLDKPIKTVAVTVSPELSDIAEIENAGFDYVQIHGELRKEVLEGSKLPIIKAFNVRDMGDHEKYRDCEKIAGFVFDAGIPGSGTAFDYSLLPLGLMKNTKGKIMLLAGGLNPDNVSKALKDTGFKGADTSTGVEREDGNGKSREKIFSFVLNARAEI